MTDRTYHHGDLRQTIIDAACEHLRESGADTLSLRAIARKVGVSQTAPYRHFDSKNALFAAVAVYGFNLLEVEVGKARELYKDDVELALVEVGLAYVNWALANPEKYHLFYDSSLVEFEHYDDLIEAGNSTFKVIISMIEQGVREGKLIDKPFELLAGSVWTSIHGVTSLLISKADIEVTGMDSPIVSVMAQINSDTRSILELHLAGLKK